MHPKVGALGRVKDFELIGCPLGIIVGQDVDNGEVSFVDRVSLEKRSVKLDDVLSEMQEKIK